MLWFTPVLACKLHYKEVIMLKVKYKFRNTIAIVHWILDGEIYYLNLNLN